MKFNHNPLFISSQYPDGDNPLRQVLEESQTKLVERGFEIRITHQISDGLRIIEKSPQYSETGFYWEPDNPTFAGELQYLISIFCKRNATTPLIVFSGQSITGYTPLDVSKEVGEYVYLFFGFAASAANQLYSLVHRYADKFPSPYSKTLRGFIENDDYYWDCPRYTGGMAYLEHPVDVEFVNFPGENMMRADTGVATAEMGDYLTHAELSKKLEEIAARLSSFDWTFYGVSGSSGLNRTAAQIAVGIDEIAIIDRSCHKLPNHGLTLSQAKLVYLKLTHNAWGLTRPIPVGCLKKADIDALVVNNRLVFGTVSQSPLYAVVTNCTCDSFCYNVNDVVRHPGESTLCIHFDEAWYIYARLHPLYQSRYTMGAEETPNRPTLPAVQSTHKTLLPPSTALMTHAKESDRVPLSFDGLNDALMIHGTTPLYYPTITSIDVAASIMEGKSGYSLAQESVEKTTAFHKAVVSARRQLQEQEGGDARSFDMFQPAEVQDSDSGQRYSSEEAPVPPLSHSADCWSLRPGGHWHSFADDDLVETSSMLDLVKVALIYPGIGLKGEYQKNGIPGYLLICSLDDRRIEIVRTGNYTVPILSPAGITKGRWGTLIESLLTSKRCYDNDDLVTDAISSLKMHSLYYDTLTLKELCQIMYRKMDELEPMSHISDTVNTNPESVTAPAEAYQKAIHYKIEYIRLDDFSSRIVASMSVPYSPGIPVPMPGERMS